MPLVEVAELEKSYRVGEMDVPVLRGINLQIEEGEFVALMGPSGCGKSTLMNILGGLDRPSRGRALLKGQDLGRLSDGDLARIRRDEIGFVFQSFNLIGRISNLRNVELPMTLKELPREERRDRAEELLEAVGLGHRLNYSPTNLSGGERQRVAIARALANDPSLILADEPTGNLDQKSRREIIEIMKGLNREGRTIIMVTHDAETTEYCSRVIWMRDGRVQEGAS
ncbi:MAG TPA: ABC transporter ATP-binding protein [Methanothrix sp.]|nr:ABC transporter ATP-binding protein [Methanothrix sp.]